ncbi:MAG TPA: hypothetical protein VHC22_00990 [Pirellulales bacterium]|nr:hypothetical protein [Pirellulales bacterium]
MRTMALAMAVGGMLAFSSPAQAQFGGPFGGPMFGGFGGGGLGGFGGFGGWGWGTYGAGSTVAGSFLAGSAMQTAAAGEAVLYGSMAAKNYQDAYQHWIENQKLRETTYFDMRRMNASYRAETHGPVATPEQLVSFSKSRLPERLGPEQLDPERGQIKWPHVLLRDEFAAERAALEYLFAERATRPYSTGIGTQNYREVRRVTDDMHDLLRTMLDVITPDEFITGNKFVNSVAYEARFEPDASLVTN